MKKSHSKKLQNPVGRPSILSNERVGILEWAFSMGLNVKEACIYAQISRDTYYSYCKKSREFSDRMHGFQRYLLIAAQLLIAKAIVEDHDLKTSRWYLSKRDSRYSNRKTIIKTKYRTIIKYVMVDELPKAITA